MVPSDKKKPSIIICRRTGQKSVFTCPICFLQKYKKLEKSYLVRSKIYPLERKVGSEKCNSKRCLVCLNVSKTDVFQSFLTKKQYKINHQLNCNDKCLIYLLSCKVCGLQYVGSTTDKFRLRWNNYKENNPKAKRGEEHMEPLVFEHFCSNDHNGFVEDCSITPIDKINGSDPTRREEYWRRVLKTATPYWLNTIDGLLYLGKLHRQIHTSDIFY